MKEVSEVSQENKVVKAREENLVHKDNEDKLVSLVPKDQEESLELLVKLEQQGLRVSVDREERLDREEKEVFAESPAHKDPQDLEDK